MAILKVYPQGTRFGFWTVIRRGVNAANGTARWLCHCDCGTKKEISGSHLRSGETTSCGCRQVKHGLSESLAYKSWERMLDRCYNPKHPHFRYYGGRDIGVCQRWRESFEAFHADMGERPKGTSIGRIDNERGYEPGNCRWETLAQQARNKRTTVWLEYRGRRVKLADLCDELRVKRGVVYARLKNGWPIERALEGAS